MTTAPDPQPARPKDIPRAGFTCASYEPGHNVHYASALKQAPDRTPLTAVLLREGERFILEVDGRRHEVWTHNSAAVWVLIEERDPACQWYPDLQLVCWVGQDGRHWVHLSLEPVTPCFSSEEARRAEWRRWMG